MGKRLACGDVMDGCPKVIEGETEDEVMAKAVQHAADDHGVTEVDPETAAAVKAAIKDA